MGKPAFRNVKVHGDAYYVITSADPFVALMLHSLEISQADFDRIVAITAGYSTDPRLVEMVRHAGDASAKVPYLLDEAETPESIMQTLRAVAQPHVERLAALPGALRSTIHTLLSINTPPKGCAVWCIPALLEIDAMQRAMILTLRQHMAGRRLAGQFKADNLRALQRLDDDWHILRQKALPWVPATPLPEQSQMRFLPVIEKNRLQRLVEECVIPDSPHTALLQGLTPPILRRPLPEHVAPPATGSADWLLREVGKIGRHFTRALLDIIKKRLEAERLVLQAQDYERLYRQGIEALREFVNRLP